MDVTPRRTCPAPLHGDRNAYWNAGCRCPDARQDANAWHRRRRAGSLPPRSDRTSALGVRRRLRALVALGWSLRRLAQELDVSSSLAQRWLHADQVHPDNHAAVLDLYERLSMRLPPHDHSAEQARRYARAHGWAPPLAWNDEDLDDPAARPIGVDHGGDEPVLPDEVDWVAVHRACRGRLVPRRLSAAERQLVLDHGQTSAAAAHAMRKPGAPARRSAEEVGRRRRRRPLGGVFAVTPPMPVITATEDADRSAPCRSVRRNADRPLWTVMSVLTGRPVASPGRSATSRGRADRGQHVRYPHPLNRLVDGKTADQGPVRSSLTGRGTVADRSGFTRQSEDDRSARSETRSAKP